MSTYIDVAMHAAALAVLLPLAVYSIANGSQPPQGIWVSKYYQVEKHIGLVGNLVLVAICIFSAAKIASDVGLIDKDARDLITEFVALPFLLLCSAFIWLWIRAWRKLHPEQDENG